MSLSVLFVLAMHVGQPSAAGGHELGRRDSRQSPASQPDSAAIVASVRDHALTFLARWRTEWVTAWTDPRATGAALKEERVSTVGAAPSAEGALKRLPRPVPRYGRAMNTPYERCMRSEFPWDHMGALSPVGTRIASATSVRDWCPIWSFTLAMPDMRLVIDSALPADRRARVRAERERLIVVLDSAAVRLPGDAWVAGQRVRFLVDQRRTDDAVRVGRGCRAASW